MCVCVFTVCAPCRCTCVRAFPVLCACLLENPTFFCFIPRSLTLSRNPGNVWHPHGSGSAVFGNKCHAFARVTSHWEIPLILVPFLPSGGTRQTRRPGGDIRERLINSLFGPFYDPRQHSKKTTAKQLTPNFCLETTPCRVTSLLKKHMAASS